MQSNEQKTRKGPLMPTQEQIQMMREQREKRLKRMETDLEYRKLWEKRKADFDRFSFGNDSIDSIQK